MRSSSSPTTTAPSIFRPQAVATPKEMEMPVKRIQPEKERMLLLGWSPKAPILISEYSEYVLEGSEVHVVLPDAPGFVTEGPRGAQR